jgi:hypothetical protein
LACSRLGTYYPFKVVAARNISKGARMNPINRIYRGYVDADNVAKVTVADGKAQRDLPLRLDLDNHSPTGFAWGYGGSGPAQLALALLADATGDDDLALVLHQRFKFRVIGRLKIDHPWQMSAQDVRDKVIEIFADEPELQDRINLRREP